jgi:uncharacterized Zn-finger protein
VVHLSPREHAHHGLRRRQRQVQPVNVVLAEGRHPHLWFDRRSAGFFACEYCTSQAPCADCTPQARTLLFIVLFSGRTSLGETRREELGRR